MGTVRSRTAATTTVTTRRRPVTGAGADPAEGAESDTTDGGGAGSSNGTDGRGAGAPPVMRTSPLPTCVLRARLLSEAYGTRPGPTRPGGPCRSRAAEPRQPDGPEWTAPVDPAMMVYMDSNDSSPRLATSRRGFLAASAVAAATPLLVEAAPAAAAPSAPARSVTAAPSGFTRGPGRPELPQLPDRELRRAAARDRPPAHRGHRPPAGRPSAPGTRCPAQDDPVRGIGAARDWIFAPARRRTPPRSGGRMTVELQSFVQPAGPRIPAPTTITNVIATLRGTTAPDRVYVVTGHYDSRVTDVLNGTGDAPGADDDALRRGRRAGAGPGDGRPGRPRRPSSSPPSPARSRACSARPSWRSSSRRPAPTSRACSATTSSAPATPHDGTATDPRTVRLFVEGVPTSETAQQAAIRQAVGGENDGPSRQLARFVGERGRERRHRHGGPGRSGGATGTCAAATTSRSCSRATRPRGSPSRGRTSTTSTRTSGWRTACSSATCPSSATSTTSRGWPGSTRPRSGRWPRRPGTPKDVRHRRPPR